MHKFMNAVGFKGLLQKKDLKDLLTEVILMSDRHAVTKNSEGRALAEFCRDFADGVGIAVCGEFDSENKFVYEYYYPYLTGTGITSYDDISVERHAEKDSYAAVCDDVKVGISLIFYLKNRIPYVKAQTEGRLPIRGTTVTLSGLSVNGMIILPIMKDDDDAEREKEAAVTRSKLIEAARKGDEDAIETLNMEDMDIYSNISKKIKKSDLFSIVDTYFMPYGVECDHYSILGEIVNMKMVSNRITGERVYELSIFCNDITFDIAINADDLYGEPQIGRRFKGIIWLQGNINFPEVEA